MYTLASQVDETLGIGFKRADDIDERHNNMRLTSEQRGQRKTSEADEPISTSKDYRGANNKRRAFSGSPGWTDGQGMKANMYAELFMDGTSEHPLSRSLWIRVEN